MGLESGQSPHSWPEDQGQDSKGGGLAARPRPFRSVFSRCIRKSCVFVQPPPQVSSLLRQSLSPFFFTPRVAPPRKSAKSTTWSGLLQKRFQRLPCSPSQGLEAMGLGVQVLGAYTTDTSCSRRKITIHCGFASKMKTMDPVPLGYSSGLCSRPCGFL